VNLREIEERVAAIEPRPGVEFLEDLLLAYGFPKMSVARLMSGSTDRAEAPTERLLKNKVYFRAADDVADDELYALIDAARDDDRVVKHKPRFLIVKNEARLLAGDQNTGETLDIAVDELGAHTAFFLPWAGIEKTQLENINYADVKAAEKMAKLYDEVTKHNSIETEDDIHALNVFFSRLLFCFFAEDTDVFEAGSFTNAVGSHTRESGEDTHEYLDELFDVLNQDHDDRHALPSHLEGFGYVNGNLFARQSSAPRFSATARALILECGTLDWSQINPDIFGSMIQAVVHPSQREGLGMHYTSVENIMKVIRPLFLDDMEEAFERADTIKKLERLLDRIAGIQIFDPACGSGNFLVISYKELRKLEHRILQRLIELDPSGQRLFHESVLKLDNFYGIEIDDFAHEIAILSLWLAKHQMNVEFKELFGAEIPLIPLRDAGKVVCGNAARMEWSAVCDPSSVSATYVLGNPPYAGSSMQGPEQKEDFVEYFGTRRYPKNLDYVALWFLKGAEYIAGGSATLAFVTTNSACQGDHVGLMWPHIYEQGVEITFAYQSFRWSNQARGGAGVTVAIIGLSAAPPKERLLFSPEGVQSVANIGPYLLPTPHNTIVRRRATPLAELPAMLQGSKPTDGGHLNFTAPERDEILNEDPRAREFIRQYAGSQEVLRGTVRYCLWINDADAERALTIAPIARRTEGVRAARLRGSTTAQAMADRPYRFLQRVHRDGASIVVPKVSSERRDIIPMGFLDATTVIFDKAFAIYGAEIWILGLLQSRMHMSWVRAVAGRMKTDYSYSNTIVYNTFPVPDLTDDDNKALTQGAMRVLAAREQFPDQTLAGLYDPDEMPAALRAAHAELDETVDRIYRDQPFESDEERLALLFEMYEAAIAADSKEPSHA
jgi:hypothetical protein